MFIGSFHRKNKSEVYSQIPRNGLTFDLFGSRRCYVNYTGSSFILLVSLCAPMISLLGIHVLYIPDVNIL